MNTYAMAEAYVKDAERSLREAVMSMEEKAFHRCVELRNALSYRSRAC